VVFSASAGIAHVSIVANAGRILAA
jgi:hypothetical protein